MLFGNSMMYKFCLWVSVCHKSKNLHLYRIFSYFSAYSSVFVCKVLFIVSLYL